VSEETMMGYRVREPIIALSPVFAVR